MFTVKTYSVTTGTTAHQEYYYADIDLSSDINEYGTPISVVITSISNNGFGIALFYSASKLRIFTKLSEKTVGFRITYLA